MKQIKGYLLDKATGAGISGKTVTFTKLDGSLVTTADTLAQATSSVTASDGSFYGNFELSPGPINVQVDAGISEVKKRINDERAEFGYQWASDISRFGRGMKGVVGGYLNELIVSIPAGHTIRIGTGAAIFNGNVFSIEMAPQDIAGTANANAAISSRVDLVTLRQYNESAAGQLSGKQQIVITQGTTSGVAPALPTGSDFVDFPLAEVATAYNASTKTVKTDLRTFTAGSNGAKSQFTQKIGPFNKMAVTTSYTDVGTLTLTGLNPMATYDGFLTLACQMGHSGASVEVAGYFDLVGSFFPTAGTDMPVYQAYSTTTGYENDSFFWLVPVVGLTGVSTYTIPLRVKKTLASGGTSPLDMTNVVVNAILRPR